MDERKHYRGFKVTEIWGWFGADDNGEEGLALHGRLPLMASDPKRLAQIRPLAEIEARRYKTKLVLKHFTLVDEEVFDGTDS